ncbi:MAG: acyltransferase [Candidatus Thalassarchaeaceae archaeon]|nr:MAG: hypothetical protein CMA04_002460 [Euryarchaeota archaeon]RPG76049.1 MAG: hypothetical protein CBC45_001215 [Euryarchaeota archaeon TMED85]|tara:strand:- start:4252 stop:4974 length:723 start_codon:yes stop_codon:yes gene_type:complete
MAKPMKFFGFIQMFLSVLVLPFGFLIWGVSAIPGIWMFQEVSEITDPLTRLFAQGAAIGIGLLAWCIVDLLILGFFGLILRPRTSSAQAPTQSWLTLRWGFMSLFHRLALPSLQWMVPSFVGNIYYSMMGMKIRNGAQINSPNINDAYMIEVGSKTVIGGGAAINGHLFEKDGIHLAKVIIGSNCVIGSGSFIAPGCIIGDRAVIASRAVLPKFTIIPQGEIWGGIPARRIREASSNESE